MRRDNCCCENVIYVTLDQATQLVNSGSLSIGSLYRISGVHKNKPLETIPVLYDDGTNSGVDIYLKALTANEFSAEGWGEFWNPRYDRTGYGNEDGDIGVSIVDSGTGYSDATGVATTGGSGVGFTVDITTIAGSIDTITVVSEGTGYVRGDILTVDDGDTNATFELQQGVYLYNIWDGNNPATSYYPKYEIGRKIIWGGYVWTNVTGLTGTAVSETELSADWEKIAYNKTDYELVIDYIEYDFENDWIVRRKNSESQVDVIFPFGFWNGANNSFVSLHAISVSQWGLPYMSDNDTGVQSVVIDNSYCEFVNFKGSYITYIKFYGNSIRNNGYIGVDCYIKNIKLDNNCFQNGIILNRGSDQQDFDFSNSCSQGSILGTKTVLIDNSSNQRRFYFVNASAQQGNISILNNSFQNHFNFENESGQGQDNGQILLDNSSYQDVINFHNQCYQYNFTLDNGGHQNQLSLTDFCDQSNFILDSATQSRTHFESLSIDYGGNTITGSIEDLTDGDATSLIYRFNKIFDGSSGNGATGAITIPDMYIPAGFFISETSILSTGLIFGVGSYITLGIETDDIDSGLDSTSGDCATLSGTPIFVLNSLPFTQATTLRKLVMAVNVDDITAGTINIIVTLTKL